MASVKKIRELMSTPISDEEDDEMWETASRESGLPLAPAPKTACATCPFRICNNGRANKFAPAEALQRAWEGHEVGGRPIRPNGGVRNGMGAACHNHTDSKRGPHEWVKNVPALRPCPGALVVQQREAIRWHEHGTAALPESAIRRIVRQLFRPERTVWLNWFKSMDREQILDAAHPAISDPAIGHPDLEPPKPGEFD